MIFEEQLLKLATKFAVIFSAIFLVVMREARFKCLDRDVQRRRILHTDSSLKNTLEEN